MKRISLAVGLGLTLFSLAVLAQDAERRKKNAADFDMASYLAELSTEGKQRGYQEFTYKQTPQGELRVYFKMPSGWSPSDKRPVLIFFFGGGWTGGKVFS